MYCVVKPTLNRDEPPKVAIQCNIFIDGPKGPSSNLAWTLPHCPHCFRPRLWRKKPSNYFQRPAAKGFIKPGRTCLCATLGPFGSSDSVGAAHLVATVQCKKSNSPAGPPGPASIKIEPYLIATPYHTMMYSLYHPLLGCPPL